MQIGLKDAEKIRIGDQKDYRRKMKLLILITVAVLLVSLCVRHIGVGFVSPVETFVNLKTWIHLNLGKAFNWPIYLERFSLLRDMDTYPESVGRLKITVITFLCGMLLALSGMLFQSVFRNPIAAPTMLGVSTGVQLGILILINNYGAMALSMPLEKYEYCYIGAVCLLALVMFAGKLSSGKKKFSVFDLLLVSAVLSQIVGAAISYYTVSMENEELLLYQQISKAMSVNIEPVSFLALLLALVISLVPVYLMRFSFNAISFDNEESSCMGISVGRLKIIALLLGTLMITAAMVHCGSVGMVSLIVPFISRGIFGAEFRRTFWGNLLIGGTLLVLCRDVASMVKFGGDGLPVGTVVEFVTLPIFVLILFSQRRTWE